MENTEADGNGPESLLEFIKVPQIILSRPFSKSKVGRAIIRIHVRNTFLASKSRKELSKVPNARPI